MKNRPIGKCESKDRDSSGNKIDVAQLSLAVETKVILQERLRDFVNAGPMESVFGDDAYYDVRQGKQSSHYKKDIGSFYDVASCIAAILDNSLSQETRSQIERFFRDKESPPLLLIRGFPNFGYGKTPSKFNDHSNSGSLGYILAGIAGLMKGKSFFFSSTLSFGTENENISKAFGLHIDCMHGSNVENFSVLGCIRGNEQAHTVFIAMDDLVKKLPPKHIDILKSPILVDPMDVGQEPFPFLIEDNGHYYFHPKQQNNQFYIKAKEPAKEETRNALELLSKASKDLESIQTKVTLRPGDILIFDNHRTVLRSRDGKQRGGMLHGRTRHLMHKIPDERRWIQFQNFILDDHEAYEKSVSDKEVVISNIKNKAKKFLQDSQLLKL